MSAAERVRMAGPGAAAEELRAAAPEEGRRLALVLGVLVTVAVVALVVAVGTLVVAVLAA